MRKNLKTPETRLNTTGLLVSVRNADEASLAFAAGVDIVDIKEPGNGPLGMATLEQIKSILIRSPGEACVSLALGELYQLSKSSLVGIGELIANYASIRFVKIGLSGMVCQSRWQSQWSQAIAHLPPGVVPVAVAYADFSSSLSPAPGEIIQTGARLNCGAVLVDTFDKTGGNVFTHLGLDELASLRHRAADLGMKFVLAGSIDHDSLAEAVRLNPDWIGIRGAVCQTGFRENAICFDALVQLRQDLNQMMKSEF